MDRRPLFWNFISQYISQFLRLVIGILLARLIHPEIFAKIALVAWIPEVGLVFINSGMTQAIIRYKDLSQEQISTVFWYNFFWGFCFFVFGSVVILSSYNGIFGDLWLVILYLCLMPAGALMLLNRALLMKSLNYRALGLVDNIALILSAIFAIVFAYRGYLILALIIYQVAQSLLRLIGYWVLVRQKISLQFSFTSIKKIRSTSNYLMTQGLLDAGISGVINNAIGINVSMLETAYFSKARGLQGMLGRGLGNALGQVNLSAMAISEEGLTEIFIKHYRKAILASGFIFVTIFIYGSYFIEIAYGPNWLNSVKYLQYLSPLCLIYTINKLLYNKCIILGLERRIVVVETVRKMVGVVSFVILIRFSMVYAVLSIVFFSLLGTILLMSIIPRISVNKLTFYVLNHLDIFIRLLLLIGAWFFLSYVVRSEPVVFGCYIILSYRFLYKKFIA